MKKYLAIAGAGLMIVGTAGLAAAATIDVGGEVRIRYENRENLTFNDEVSDNVHGTTQRTRVNVNAKVNDDISAFIQLQNVRTWGGTGVLANDATDTTGAFGSTGTDTHQAYLQVNKVFGTPLAVRLGRQELSYGDERLIGNLNWSQISRSFDAAKVLYKSADLDVDVWSAKTVEMTTQTDIVASSAAAGETLAEKGSDNDQDFYGIWATYKGIKDNTIDLYALLLKDRGTTTGTLTLNGIGYGDSDTGNTDGAADIYTLGARLKGMVGGFDYVAEYDYQTGTGFNGNDISAQAYAATVGYTLAMDMSPRISAEYVHADGDGNSSDADIETFNQLFPTGHRHLGYADLVGFQNVDAWRIGASIKPTKASSVSVDYWNFELDDSKDAWYRASGGVVKAASATNSDDEIGSEVDVIAKYKYADNLSLEAGYSLFMPGDLVDQGTPALTGNSGKDDEHQWVYGMVTLTF